MQERHATSSGLENPASTLHLVVMAGTETVCQSVLLNVLPLVECGAVRLLVEPGHVPSRRSDPYLLVHGAPGDEPGTVVLRTIAPTGSGTSKTVPTWALPEAILGALDTEPADDSSIPDRRSHGPMMRRGSNAPDKHPSWRHGSRISRRRP